MAQVGPLDSEEWDVAIRKFLAVMRNRKAVEWTDLKELTPLQFMPYVKFENLIEDCQMQEEEVRHAEEDEAHMEEEIHQEQEVTDTEMADEEERGDPEPSATCGEADTKGPPPLASTEDAVSPEEDTLLMQPASQPKDPAAGSHSPRSKTGTVSGEMAELCLTSPSQPRHEEDETPP